jgi:hypothetical protein
MEAVHQVSVLLQPEAAEVVQEPTHQETPEEPVVRVAAEEAKQVVVDREEQVILHQ